MTTTSPAPGSLPQLVDSFGRVHDSLRISVTDRCNLRCFYCMPAENARFMDRADLLTYEEMECVARALVPVGIRKLRLTGGEPLVRRDLPELVRRLASIPGIDDIGLTTNGLLLRELARPLYAAGLRRLNVSLDALSPEAFRAFARRDGLNDVLAGIAEAKRVGFDPVKVNAVAVRGMTEAELPAFVRFVRETGVELRFIEYMPLDAENAWERDKVLYASEIRERLAELGSPVLPVVEPLGASSSSRHAPASEHRLADGGGTIGFIASVSEPFCADCNRIRLTADGKLRNCLFSLEETDLRAIIRSGGDDDAIRAAVRESVAAKKEGHEINTSRFLQPSRPMHAIGG